MLYKLIIVVYACLYAGMIIHDLFFDKDVKTAPRQEEEEIDISEEAKEFASVEIFKDPPAKEKTQQETSQEETEQLQESAQEPVQQESSHQEQVSKDAGSETITASPVTSETPAVQPVSQTDDSQEAEQGADHDGIYKVDTIAQEVELFDETGKCKDLADIYYEAQLKTDNIVGHSEQVKEETDEEPQDAATEDDLPEETEPETEEQITFYDPIPEEGLDSSEADKILSKKPTQYTGKLKIEKVIDFVKDIDEKDLEDFDKVSVILARMRSWHSKISLFHTCIIL